MEAPPPTGLNPNSETRIIPSVSFRDGWDNLVLRQTYGLKVCGFGFRVSGVGSRVVEVRVES